MHRSKNFLLAVIVLVLSAQTSCVLAANSAPILGTVTPASGNITIGVWTNVTCTYSDADGHANLAACYLLINSSVSPTGAAYLVYNANTNKFYVKNNAGTDLPIGGVTPGTVAVIESENVALDCSGSTVTRSGNNATIKWRIRLKSTMQKKTCGLYMKATDDAGAYAGFTSKGSIYANSAPVASTVFPKSGTMPFNSWMTFTVTYTDVDGATTMRTCELLINSHVSDNGAAHFLYDRHMNLLYMKNNSGVASEGTAPGSAVTLETENAKLDCANTSVSTSGNNLTVAFRVMFKSTMAAKVCALFTQASDDRGAIGPWASKGVIRINSNPAIVSVTPAVGNHSVDTWRIFTCVYADPDGAANLAWCGLMVNNAIANSGAAQFLYNETTNKLYMKNNAGTLTPVDGIARGTASTIETENAILDCAGTTVAKSGNYLTIKWRVKFKSTMVNKSCNLYMNAADDLNGRSDWQSKGTAKITPSQLASYLNQAVSKLNQAICMDPYNAGTAKALIQQAKDLFAQAKAIETSDPRANFGLAITNAALTVQNLIDKYHPILSTQGGPSVLSNAVNSLAFLNLPNVLNSTSNTLNSYVTSYMKPAQAFVLHSNGAHPQLVLDMQNDLKSIVLPMLRTVSSYLDVAEQAGSSFEFIVGSSPSSCIYYVLDIGDVRLLHGALLLARWALAIPASYNPYIDNFEGNLTLEDRDLDHNGILTRNELLPPSPCGTLVSPSIMTAAKSDLIKGAEKLHAGLMDTLAETSDNYELIPWHTPGSGTTRDDLVRILDFAQQLRLAATAPTPVQGENEDGEPFSMIVYLGAWNDNPPPDLTFFVPSFRKTERPAPNYEYLGIGTTEWLAQPKDLPDITLGGLFPNGWPQAPEDEFSDIGWEPTVCGVTTTPANLATGVSRATNVTVTWNNSHNGWQTSGYVFTAVLDREIGPYAWQPVAVSTTKPNFRQVILTPTSTLSANTWHRITAKLYHPSNPSWTSYTAVRYFRTGN
ncbi:MAG: Ig-like domain-containing protein [Armatimonadetes bacterium]|nr:Ig-like domain-containing protein [Armatimonadota bacterium]